MDRNSTKKLSADELAQISGGIRQGEGAQVFTYCVRPGETLSGIADRYNVTIAEIQELNKWLKDPNSIEAGSILLIPSAAN